jgi:peptidylprolyl isomerase
MNFKNGMLAFIAAIGLVAGAASPAMAQAPRQPKEEKAIPVLPKMAPPPTLPGTLAEVPEENILYLDLSTGGRVKIVMRPDAAPKHVERIRLLTREGFYNGLIFHRVIDGFMAQGGDPTGTGQGSSTHPDLTAEFNDLPHVRGAVAMARAQDVNSANSQFYIVLQPVLKLDRTYTIWGRVVSGMEFVDAIEKGEPPENPSKIIRASIGSDRIPPPAPSTPIPAAPKPAPAAPAAPDFMTPKAPKPPGL